MSNNKNNNNSNNNKINNNYHSSSNNHSNSNNNSSNNNNLELIKGHHVLVQHLIIHITHKFNNKKIIVNIINNLIRGFNQIQILRELIIIIIINSHINEGLILVFIS